jgi:WD40 repeat protein
VGRGKIVHVHSTDEGQLRGRLAGHEQSACRAICSPDGRQLATVSWDATVRLWDVDTGEQLFAASPARRPRVAKSAL